MSAEVSAAFSSGQSLCCMGNQLWDRSTCNLVSVAKAGGSSALPIASQLGRAVPTKVAVGRLVQLLVAALFLGRLPSHNRDD